MKLAEALVPRTDIQKRIEQMKGRLKASAIVQEGEQPPVDPQALLTELDTLLRDLTALIARINRTNLGTRLTASGTCLRVAAQATIL